MKILRGVVFGLFFVVLILTVVTEWNIRTTKDVTPPTIQCGSSILEVSVKADDATLLQGVTAWDDRDGDLTDQIMVEHVSSLLSANTAKITYVVFDSSDNAATCSRTIRYTDYQKPRFRLDKPLQFFVGDTITLLDRLVAEDMIDGDITEKVRMTASNLTNTLEGTYHITVQVTNSLGDTTVLPLSVIVEGGSTYRTPKIKLSKYLVYLNAGQQFHPEDYLVQVTDLSDIASNDRNKDVEIHSDVDNRTPGVYEVVYSYTGKNRETKTILTVVVI